jgi:hypothetical protein
MTFPRGGEEAVQLGVPNHWRDYIFHRLSVSRSAESLCRHRWRG